MTFTAPQPASVAQPSLTARTVDGSVALDVFTGERDAPDAVLFFAADGHAITAADFADRVRAAAAGLLRAGVEPGDRVALMSKTRPEWTIADYAIWAVGGVTVPIYETSSADQVRWIVSDTGARVALVGTTKKVALMEGLGEHRPEQIWSFDDGALADLPPASSAEAATIQQRTAAVRADALATIVYTSGTTGRPKGCELTHRNFLSNSDELRAALSDAFEVPDANSVLFLPLAHVFARVAQVACIRYRITFTHVPSASDLPAVFADVRPTFIFAVPRVFEKLHGAARNAAVARGALTARLFDAAQRTAIATSLGGGRPRLTRLRHRLFDRLVYAKVRDVLGGRATHIVSAGGPLSDDLAHFFTGSGLQMLEAYGLSETICSTVNRPGQVRIGSVGRPLPGSAVRIVDGEIQLKGPSVFRGYYGNPEATKDAFTDDGWFRSGDLGRLDADGYLTITGRAKDIIITAAGKNVAPSPLEDRLRTHPVVNQAVVVGEGRPYIACLFTIDEEAIAGHPDHRDVLLQRAIDDANSLVSNAEAIKRYAVLPRELTEADGELTPTLKIRRNLVVERYASVIDEMYALTR